jgi:hypothetical protein
MPATACLPAADPPPRRLRLLCQYGYHGTASILRRQMASLAAALPPNVELVYVGAPALSEGDFGWWHEGFRGWERTRDWATGRLCAGPGFDGIFGFSQGAPLAGLLAALKDGDPSLRFEFAVMVCGFTSIVPRLARLFGQKLTVPSVHVTGRADVIVPRRGSPLLASRFTAPLAIEHPGGHVISGTAAVTAPIVDFLARFSHRPGDAAPDAAG